MAFYVFPRMKPSEYTRRVALRSVYPGTSHYAKGYTPFVTKCNIPLYSAVNWSSIAAAAAVSRGGNAPRNAVRHGDARQRVTHPKRQNITAIVIWTGDARGIFRGSLLANNPCAAVPQPIPKTKKALRFGRTFSLCGKRESNSHTITGVRP